MDLLLSFIRKYVGVLCVLFCAAVLLCSVLAAYGISISPFVSGQLRLYDAQAPLAAPTVCVESADGGDLLLSSETEASLLSLGRVVCATVGQTYTLEGIALSLFAMPQNELCDAVRLLEGSLPQNEDECIIVALTSGGATLLPVGSTLTVPDETTETVSRYRIVGIGDNVTATLTAVCTPPTDFLVFTNDGAAWTKDTFARNTVCLLADAMDDPGALCAAVSRIFSETASAQLNEVIAAEKAHIASLEASLNDMNSLIEAQEITMLDAENAFHTATLRVNEAEEQLTLASDALEKDRQQFYSDMEKYSYYSSNQVALIKRQELAEERFAKREVEIDVLIEALAAARNAYDAADAAFASETADYTALIAQQTELAQTVTLRTLATENPDRTAPAVTVTHRTAQADYVAAMQIARDSAARTVLVAILFGLLAIFLAVIMCLYTALRRRVLLMCMLACVLIGVGIGAAVLPSLSFSALYGIAIL